MKLFMKITPARLNCSLELRIAASGQPHNYSPAPILNTAPPGRSSDAVMKEAVEISHWDRLLDPVDYNSAAAAKFFRREAVVKLSDRWKEYQGSHNWEGLLDPLDDILRSEILRYGGFADAAYKSFDFDTCSPTYANCRYPNSTLLQNSGLPATGYRLSSDLHATSGIQMPRWIERAPKWVGVQSSWMGYVAVCVDKDEISRLGRRDIVIAYRGTATCLEWLENLRATLTDVAGSMPCSSKDCRPMVESGFLSLYTSGTATSPSLQQMVRSEISRLLQVYGGAEPLSLTITGHSLGAALATLTAHDIKTTFRDAPPVTVISFGGPRVGNGCFRQQLEKQGTKVLRIVNSDDLITKVPGFVVDEVAEKGRAEVAGLPRWIQKRVMDTQWVYAEVGRELRLRSRDSPYLNGINAATCHELKTYLHLVNGFVSSTCPFRSTAREVLNHHHHRIN